MEYIEDMSTPHCIVKKGFSESVLAMACLHKSNATFGATLAPELDCFALLAAPNQFEQRSFTLSKTV